MSAFKIKIDIDDTMLNSRIQDVVDTKEKEFIDPCRCQLKSVQLSLKFELKPTITNNKECAVKIDVYVDDTMLNSRIKGVVDDKRKEFVDHCRCQLKKVQLSLKCELKSILTDNTDAKQDKNVNTENEDFEMLEKPEEPKPVEKVIDSDTSTRDICSSIEEPTGNLYRICLGRKWTEFLVLCPKKGKLCDKIFNTFTKMFGPETIVHIRKAKGTDREYPSLMLCLCTSRVRDDVSCTLSMIGEVPTKVMLIGLESCEKTVRPNRLINSIPANIPRIKAFTNIVYSRVHMKCYESEINSSAFQEIRRFLMSS